MKDLSEKRRDFFGDIFQEVAKFARLWNFSDSESSRIVARNLNSNRDVGSISNEMSIVVNVGWKISVFGFEASSKHQMEMEEEEEEEYQKHQFQLLDSSFQTRSRRKKERRGKKQKYDTKRREGEKAGW